MKFNAMDIDAAIAAHKAWRSRFCIAIEGIDADKLNDLSVMDHTSCVLGTWLYSPKQQECLNLSVFRDILETHKDFHQTASQIIGLLGDAKVDEAQHALDSHFAEVSTTLILLLEEFKEFAPGSSVQE
jgi:hypothetical protein